MAKNMRRRGISPVIATVIIVAVAIAIAIAVAFWMTGIVGLFTTFEQVQIQSAYAIYNTSINKFQIIMRVKNTGTAPAAIDNIFINNIPFNIRNTPITVYINGTSFNPDNGAFPLPPGKEVPIIIEFNKKVTWGNAVLDDGVSIEVKVHTTSGKEYPKLIVLP